MQCRRRCVLQSYSPYGDFRKKICHSVIGMFKPLFDSLMTDDRFNDRNDRL